jgi:hypothetical protein
VRQGIVVTVQANQHAIRRGGLKDQPGMSGAPKGAIKDRCSGLQIKQIQSFLRQHRQVNKVITH